MKTLIAIVLMFLMYQPVGATSIGLISDIHSGKEKVRLNSSGSKVYPKKGEATFKKSLKVMKKKGVEFVLVMGDSTNSNSDKYAKGIKKIARSSKMTVLFAKGNHDKNGFRFLNENFYYLREINGVKIMVLDTNYTDLSSIGQIEPTQRQWVYDNIKGVDIIAMHHPVAENCVVNPRYQWIDDLVKENGVQKVYSGHTHTKYQCGVYRGVPALTTSGYVIDTL